MKQTMRASKTLLGGLVLFAALALVVQDAAAQPILESATCFGGTGDERGTGIAIADGAIYVSGITGTGSDSEGLVVQYALPPVSPVWSDTWPDAYGWDRFLGVAVSSEGVYLAGDSYSQTYDPVGTKEAKPILVKYPLEGTTPLWLGEPRSYFFRYSGSEWFSSTAVSVEDDSTFIYATGSAQAGWYNRVFFITKYDMSGDLINKATEPGFDFGSYSSVWAFGSGNGLAVLNGSIYAAGFSTSFEGSYPGTSPGCSRPLLIKYDPELNRIWRHWVTDLAGCFNGVTAYDGAIYAVGYTYTPGVAGSYDCLIQKYGEDGNLQWSNEWGGPAQEIAYGIAVNGDRLYVVGETSSFDAEGKDAFLLEVDAADGTILSTTFWGGPADDTGQDVAVAGPDIYVVGKTASFGAGGYDLVLLRYTSILEVVIDIKPGSEPNSINLGAQGVVPVAILTTLDFDAAWVDEFSLTLSGSEVRLKGRSGQAGSMEDVDGDGYLDLVVQFYIDQLDLEEGATEAVLEGFTLDGIPIIGFDWINVVP